MRSDNGNLDADSHLLPSCIPHLGLPPAASAIESERNEKDGRRTSRLSSLAFSRLGKTLSYNHNS